MKNSMSIPAFSISISVITSSPFSLIVWVYSFILLGFSLGFLFLTYEFRFLSYYSSHPLPSPFPKSLAFHIPYLHIQTVFLFFSWVTYPYFHWLCISFLLLCVRSRSLLGHIKFWPALSYFLNIKMKSSCAPRKVA